MAGIMCPSRAGGRFRNRLASRSELGRGEDLDGTPEIAYFHETMPRVGSPRAGKIRIAGERREQARTLPAENRI
jgi:hypothetical protein